MKELEKGMILSIIGSGSPVQRFSEILRLNQVKTSTAHVQYLKDQTGKDRFLLFCNLQDL